MRHSPTQVPAETLRYVGTLTDNDLAAHLMAYRVSSDLYALPLYLVALIHEASQRIKNNIKENSHES